MASKRKSVEWVLPGGKPGEIGYCTRCGSGLRINMPQPIEIAVACMEAFVKMHAKCAPGNYVEKPAQTPEEWAMGRDTGTSSLTIYHVLTGNASPHGRYDVPHDPQDFGRCYRLLKLFPAWRGRIAEVATRFPEWKPMIREWARLEGMYEAAIASTSQRAPEMYDLMQNLEKEGKSTVRP